MRSILFSFCLLMPFMTYAKTQALHQLVYEIRDPKTDALHFRNALEKIGEYLALDVLEQLEVEEETVETLTGEKATHPLLKEMPVLVTILRAGLPLCSGMQKIFPHSAVGFLAMSRNEVTLKAEVDYVALPDLRGKNVILADTMLATGGSILDAIRIIEKHQPKQIFVVAAIAAEPGKERILAYDPTIKIFAAALDPFLNENGYIIPGLGDAGDRSYGKKHVFSKE